MSVFSMGIREMPLSVAMPELGLSFRLLPTLPPAPLFADWAGPGPPTLVRQFGHGIPLTQKGSLSPWLLPEQG